MNACYTRTYLQCAEEPPDRIARAGYNRFLQQDPFGHTKGLPGHTPATTRQSREEASCRATRRDPLLLNIDNR